MYTCILPPWYIIPTVFQTVYLSSKIEIKMSNKKYIYYIAVESIL